MTNVIFPSSGGTIVLNYSLKNCSSSESVVTFEPQENWYYFQQDSQNCTVTLTASTASDNRSGSIIVTVNGSACTLSTIEIHQDKETVCDCDSFSQITLSYVIPYSGAPSGTVIGSYSLHSSCNEGLIHFSSPTLVLGASNGNIYLREDVSAIPDTSPVMEHSVKMYYGNNLTECASEIIPQGECNCDNIFKYVHRLYRNFSNLSDENHPRMGYTPLGINDGVMILSGSTACGRFTANASGSTALNTVISGITCENKVLIVQDDNNIYAYVHINENPNGFTRSIGVDLQYWVKSDNDSGETLCSVVYAYLLQSESNYVVCPSNNCKDLISYSASVEDVRLIPYNDTTYRTFGYITPESSLGVGIELKITEVGYCDVTAIEDAVMDWHYELSSISPDTSAVISDWADICYNGNTNRIDLRFLQQNPSERFKYVKYNVDLYTDKYIKVNAQDDPGDNTTNTGVYCCSLTFYGVQAPQKCCDCDIIQSQLAYGETTIDYKAYSSYEYSITNPNEEFICSYDVRVVGVQIVPSAGTSVELEWDYPDHNITAYTYTIPQNDSDSEITYELFEIIEGCDGSSQCQIQKHTFVQRYNTCKFDCQDLISATTFIGHEIAQSGDVDCSDRGPGHTTYNGTATTVGDTCTFPNGMPYIYSYQDCIKAYFVPMKKVQEGVWVEDIDHYQGRYGLCPGKNENPFWFSLTNYDQNYGWEITGRKTSIVIQANVPEVPDSNIYASYPNFVYRVDYYLIGETTPLCSSELYTTDSNSPSYSITVQNPPTGCTEYLRCSAVIGRLDLTLDSSLIIGQDNRIEIPATGVTDLLIGTLAYGEGTDASTIYIYDDTCPDIYEIRYWREDDKISSTITGSSLNELRISMAANTTSAPISASLVITGYVHDLREDKRACVDNQWVKVIYFNQLY